MKKNTATPPANQMGKVFQVGYILVSLRLDHTERTGPPVQDENHCDPEHNGYRVQDTFSSIHLNLGGTPAYLAPFTQGK
jgi:hypothetical protein